MKSQESTSSTNVAKRSSATVCTAYTIAASWVQHTASNASAGSNAQHRSTLISVREDRQTNKGYARANTLQCESMPYDFYLFEQKLATTRSMVRVHSKSVLLQHALTIGVGPWCCGGVVALSIMYDIVY